VKRDRAPSDRPARGQLGKSTLRSFQYAWEGLAFAFSTQKHMRVHAVVIALTIAAALGLDVAPAAFLNILLAMTLVVVTELFNTSIEHAVDLAVDHYDPRAKVAKDVAASAVLVASGYAVVVAFFVFAYSSALPKVMQGLGLPRHVQFGSLQMAAVGMVLVALVIATVKHVTGRGRFAFGGPVSGHAALAFLFATGIVFITGNVSVALLAMALATLVAQSRVQGGIHSLLEVVLGGVLGSLLGFLLFAGGVSR
jgi:diacylglycerol kinase (ATP)